MQLTKTCARCNRVLAMSMYHKNSGNKDGYYSYCKDCKVDENRKHVVNRKERERAKALAEKAAREAMAKVVDPRVALPRTFNHNNDKQYWTGHPERQYIREDGNKRIPSRGFV